MATVLGEEPNTESLFMVVVWRSRREIVSPLIFRLLCQGEEEKREESRGVKNQEKKKCERKTRNPNLFY
jgi:hypothetical protein